MTDRQREAKRLRDRGLTYREIGVALGGVSSTQAQRLVQKEEARRRRAGELEGLDARIQGVLLAEGCTGRADVETLLNNLDQHPVVGLGATSILRIRAWLGAESLTRPP